MAGGMGIGGMGMGMSMPSISPMNLGPMSFGMGMMSSMSPASTMQTPNMFGPSLVSQPTMGVQAGPMPMQASYLSVAPAMSQVPQVPQGAIAPNDLSGPNSYYEGQIMPNPNAYGAQDLSGNTPRIYDPYDIGEDVTKGRWGDAMEPGDGMGDYQPGTMRTPEYSPDNLRDFPTTELSAQSKPNALNPVKGQVAQNTFNALGGAGPSADALNSTNPNAPDSSFKAPVDPRLGGNQVSNNVRMMDSALEKAGFSPNQRNGLLEQIHRENGFRNELLFGTHAEPARNAAYGRENIGALSWGDPGRNAAFKAAMRAEGVMNADGTLKPGQATLDAQARFIRQEMGTYPNTKAKFLDNPNVDINTSRVVLGDDYIGWRRTDPAYSSHTGKMVTFQNNLNNIRAGGNPFPTPTQGSMANVPTQSYGRVALTDMRMQPTPLQQAAIATAPTPPMTAAQSMQRAFTVSPVQVTTPQAATAPAPVAPVQAAPQISASTALEQAFMTPMPENGQSFDPALAQRAQQNLTNLTNPPAPAPSIMSGGDRPTSEMIFAQPDATTVAAGEVPINPVEPSEAAVAPSMQQIQSPQNAPVRPLEARTGVSSNRVVPTPRAKSSGSVEPYSPDYYLSNESLLRDQGGQSIMGTPEYEAMKVDLSKSMKIGTAVIDAVTKGLGTVIESRKKKK